MKYIEVYVDVYTDVNSTLWCKEVQSGNGNCNSCRNGGWLPWGFVSYLAPKSTGLGETASVSFAIPHFKLMSG